MSSSPQMDSALPGRMSYSGGSSRLGSACMSARLRLTTGVGQAQSLTAVPFCESSRSR